jgi:heme exporter protein D
VSYVLLGYAVTLLALAAYAARVILRGRALVRSLPPDAEHQ